MSEIGNNGGQKPKRGNPAWHKGMDSPNPTGRGKQVSELLQAFRDDVPLARTLCSQYLKDKNADGKLRLEAAKLVLAYGLGRPPQIEAPDDDLANMSDEELRGLAKTLLGEGNAPTSERVQ